MRPDEVERRLRERLDALGPAPRAELLHILVRAALSWPSGVIFGWQYFYFARGQPQISRLHGP
jgi:hypothetical protein